MPLLKLKDRPLNERHARILGVLWEKYVARHNQLELDFEALENSVPEHTSYVDHAEKILTEQASVQGMLMYLEDRLNISYSDNNVVNEKENENGKQDTVSSN